MVLLEVVVVVEVEVEVVVLEVVVLVVVLVALLFLQFLVWYNCMYVRHWGNNKLPNTILQLKMKVNTFTSTK